jgi:hypothetical protein
MIHVLQDGWALVVWAGVISYDILYLSHTFPVGTEQGIYIYIYTGPIKAE